VKFALLFLATLFAVVLAQGAAPVFFQALDPVRPDETLLLFGADVTPEGRVEGLCLKDDAVTQPPTQPATSPPGKFAPMAVLQASDLSAKVVIPKSWRPGVYAVRARNADGVSAWQFINRPALWWQLSGVGGRANPGGELRIFGKNFGPRARLWLRGAGGTRELPLRIARDFDVAATIPADVVPGKYELWIHNGHGDEAGFGEPLAIEVAPREAWPDRIFDVRKLGARGDNETDDTETIHTALRQAKKNGGGIVFFPRGTYIVRGKLAVPPKTVLRGEGRDVVWLKVPVNAPPFQAVIAGNGHFGVENLSIIARPVERLIASPDRPPSYGPGRANWNVMDGGDGDVTLRNLRLQHLTFTPRVREGDARRSLVTGSTTVALNGPDCIVEDCVIISPGAPLQIAMARRARIARNSFGTGRDGSMIFSDFEESVFEENDVQARDLEGNYGGVQGAAYHVMFRANDWHDAYGAEREALAFDTPYQAAWMGSVRQSAPDKLTVENRRAGSWPAYSQYAARLAAVVIGGPGLGQFSPISRIDGDTMTLSQSFRVPLGEKSVVAVVACKSEVLIVDNRMSDASNAMLLYSQSHAFVMAGNRCERTGGSYAYASDFRLSDTDWHLSYAYFNQWIGNSFREGLVYYQYPFSFAFLGYTAIRSDLSSVTVPAIGNRFERNNLDGEISMGVVTNVQFPPQKGLPMKGLPFSRDAIFEGNTIANSHEGIHLDAGHAEILLRDNVFSAVSRPYRDEAWGTLILPANEKP